MGSWAPSIFAIVPVHAPMFIVHQRAANPRSQTGIMGSPSAQAEAGVQVEEVEKDLDTLDEQAQRAAVAADAPELGALLAELRANLAEVRTRVGPLVKEVRRLPSSWSRLIAIPSPIRTPAQMGCPVKNLRQPSSFRPNLLYPTEALIMGPSPRDMEQLDALMCCM